MSPRQPHSRGNQRPSSAGGRHTVSGIRSGELELWRECAALDGRNLSNWVRRACNERAAAQLGVSVDGLPAGPVGM